MIEEGYAWTPWRATSLTEVTGNMGGRGEGGIGGPDVLIVKVLCTGSTSMNGYGTLVHYMQRE